MAIYAMQLTGSELHTGCRFDKLKAQSSAEGLAHTPYLHSVDSHLWILPGKEWLRSTLGRSGLDEGSTRQASRQAGPQVIGALGRRLRRACASILRGALPGGRPTAQSHRSRACLGAWRDSVWRSTRRRLRCQGCHRCCDPHQHGSCFCQGT